MTVRTRFAPSPTGYLHIGGARTALFSWLYARQHNGSFILRIEDTDRERSTQEAVDAILQGMEWLNLDYDEGPTYQTQRFERYEEVIKKLLENGDAYRCYCSKERLQSVREAQMAAKQKPRYDGHCRDINEQRDEPYVIRFKNPQTGSVIFDDLIRGKIEIQNSELDDLIIARTDGTPTYNLTVVVDDWDMEISHVIRGDDHINNTPRQINLLQALDAQIPHYAHVPMILGADGKRLSKRHGAVSVLQYKEEGFLSDALLNYLVRLGWSSGDQEVFSCQEMIQLFNIKNVNNSAATFNPEKLLWLNQQYIIHKDPNDIASELKWYFQKLNIDISQGPNLTALIEVQKERAKTLVELAESSLYFYQDVNQYDEKAAQKNLTHEALSPLELVKEKLDGLSTWNTKSIHQVIQDTTAELDTKMGKVAQPIRVALTGNTQSPSIDQTIWLLGKEKVQKHLANAIEYIQNL